MKVSHISKHRPVVTQPEIFGSPKTDMDLAAAIKPALNDLLAGRLPFTFRYQPIADLRWGSVAGYEMLVRFPQEIGLPPDRTFQIAQICGKRLELEELVTRRALEDRLALPPNTFISINVSPLLLLSNKWDRLLASMQSLERVVVEITEQDLIHDYEAVRVRMRAVRNLGGHVAVDDTGAGYASLKHMMELKPDFLKLDRYFVGDCHYDRAKATLIEMIGKAADRMDAWIIAEGVESHFELDELLRLRIPLAQGYHLGRPEETMETLTNDQTSTIRARNSDLSTTQGMRAHTESALICETHGHAIKLLRDSPTLDLAVVVDDMQRPVALIEKHPLVGIRTLSQLMKVQDVSDPSDVLTRALMRPPATRFDSLVVISRTGTFSGVVRIDRLMQANLDRLSTSNAPATPSPEPPMPTLLAN